MKTFLAKLLEYYNLTEEEYLKYSESVEQIALPDFNKIKNINIIKERIFKAIQNNEKILIYGDYDCDGITATSILKITFDKLNYPISYYIPSRYKDGYGLSIENVIKISQANFKLIICVDNGISANEAIDKANEYGIDVIVVDHHEVPNILPKAHSFLHPIVSEIGNTVGSGGCMSLLLSAALLNDYNDYLVTLAGLSIVSDLMELKDYNRDIVKKALYYLEKNRYLSLYLLLDKPVIDEKSFSLEIAPKINSVGRIEEDKEVNRVVKYLCSNDENEILKLSNYIKIINNERKELTKELASLVPQEELNEEAIVIKTNIKEGLMGLLSNKLLNEKNVPCIVFSSEKEESEGILKGSIRSKEGFNIVKALDELKEYLLTGGGHAFAGGISIKSSDFEEFKKKFIQIAKKHPITDMPGPAIDIELNEITKENYQIMRSLMPFGKGFEEPTFLIKNIKVNSLSYTANAKHLSTPISINSKLLGFNMSKEELDKYLYLDFYGNLILSWFNNKSTLEFRINNYNKSK